MLSVCVSRLPTPQHGTRRHPWFLFHVCNVCAVHVRRCAARRGVCVCAAQARSAGGPGLFTAVIHPTMRQNSSYTWYAIISSNRTDLDANTVSQGSLGWALGQVSQDTRHMGTRLKGKGDAKAKAQRNKDRRRDRDERGAWPLSRRITSVSLHFTRHSSGPSEAHGNPLPCDPPCRN